MDVSVLEIFNHKLQI